MLKVLELILIALTFTWPVILLSKSWSATKSLAISLGSGVIVAALQVFIIVKFHSSDAYTDGQRAMIHIVAYLAVPFVSGILAGLLVRWLGSKKK